MRGAGKGAERPALASTSVLALEAPRAARPLKPAIRAALAGIGWLCFGLGWAGIFMPGLPTTIFWILAALLFLRTNRRAYEKIIEHRRFGESVRQVVEEGRISRRGKLVSIIAMMGFATIGAVAMRKPLLGCIVVGLAAAGSLWVGFMPSSASSNRPDGKGSTAACATGVDMD